MMDSIPIKQASEHDWVRESRFGRWFQTTNIWYQYVLNEAMVDFKKLLNNRLSGASHILDAGCGQGLAFELLDQHFQPKVIIGVDIDKEQSNLAPEAAKRCQSAVTVENGTVYNLKIPDKSMDLIFCHQLLHHLSDQSRALKEFYRILVPGGLILIGESCRSFLNSFLVRLLFRHPLQVHKNADEYIELVKSIGFKIHDHDIKTSTPWWSRKDLGLAEKIGIPQKPLEVTEVLIIARKPDEKY